MRFLRLAILLLILTFTVNPISYESSSFQEVNCLAKTIYYETRAESVSSAVAVANVVKNRFYSQKYSSLCSVIEEPHQFPWYTHQGKILEKTAWNRSLRIAIDVYKGNFADNTFGSTFFHEQKIKPVWSKSLQKIGQIGSHIFYRNTKLNY